MLDSTSKAEVTSVLRTERFSIGVSLAEPSMIIDEEKHSLLCRK